MDNIIFFEKLIKRRQKMDAQVIAAWITAVVAIISTAVTAITGFVIQSKEKKASREAEIRKNRQDALFSALEVIDHMPSFKNNFVF
jgi:hypothetical protein